MHRLFKGSYLEVHEAATALEIALDMTCLSRPIYKSRSAVTLRNFKRAMLRIGAEVSSENRALATVPVGDMDASALLKSIKDIDHRIASIIEVPLPGRVVEEQLKITPKERIHWTKQGKLPFCSIGRSNRGHRSFTVHYYAVDVISELCEQPAIIAEWRSSLDGIDSSD